MLPDADASAPAWSPVRKVLFRFAFAYLVVFPLSFLLDAVPGAGVLSRLHERLWEAVTPWVGAVLFGVEVEVRQTGSGDRTSDYVQVFCFLVIAVAAAAVWTLLDRRRRDYRRLDRWLRVYVRLALAAIMLGYGAFKVIKAQFPGPSLDRLVQPLGDSSPMGLLWTLNGLSPGYNLFTGGVEVLGGLLLTARRTALLGALVSAGALAHVLVLNLCFDVPVKLFSAHLLAMALFLIAPDGRRLANFFLLRRAVEPPPLPALFARPRLHRGALVLRTVFVLVVAGNFLNQAWEQRTTAGDLAPRSPLRGIWVVEEFVLDGEDRPPLVTDTERWRRVIFDRPGVLAIQLMDGAPIRYHLELDETAGTMTLTARDDPASSTTLTYRRPHPDALTLEGTYAGRPLRVRLHRLDDPSFLLLDRGFHWINEFPLNR